MRVSNLGNDALHDLDKPKREGIEVALDVIEHIIEDLYEIPAKTQVLAQRKASNT